ncbi:CGNR zinc finger domain-containing protein [Lentzea sp. NPDC060358]|uniref:CGNR zinc finger domain-containing protein n=1 Tax=Lentzea sp. NPDC060358 TaxID=3347103 RepID=UPI00364BCD70
MTPDQELLLDLLNTTPVLAGTPRDELSDVDSGRAWLAARGRTASTGELRTLREVRAVLQDVVRGEAPARELAPYLEGVAYRPSLTDEGLEWRLEAPRHGEAAARVVLAWDELRTSAPNRLRPCENTECRLFLLDRSKANRARWCSMTTCGNRMKARRHYERTRPAPQP